MNKKNKNIVWVTGEYFVCAELGKLGILALLTPKNNPLFDVVAIAPDASKTISIQVKTMSEHNNQGWRLNIGICEKKNNSSLFTILVNLKEKEIEFFIYEYDILSQKVKSVYTDYMNKPKKDGTKHKDVNFRWFDFRNFTPNDYSRKNNWDILGF